MRFGTDVSALDLEPLVAGEGVMWPVVKGSPDPSKFDGPVGFGSIGGLLSKRTVMRGLKVDRAPVPL